MHPEDLLPTLSLLLVITSFTLVHLPKSFCQNQDYATCGQPIQCGSISLTYPFWGEKRPDACGYPGFNVSCQGNVPRIAVEQVTYRILTTDTSTHTLTVARDDLWDNNCPSLLHNTTLNFNIFSFPNNVVNIILSYNCTTPSTLPQQPNQFSCTGNTSTASFFSLSNITNNNLPNQVTCTASIGVPINQNAAQNLLNNLNTTGLRAALTAGFPLQYEANNSNCTNCAQSGGRCGYDKGANSFVCYCSDRPYDLVCNGTSTLTGKGGNSLTLVTGLLLSFAIVGIISAVCIICYLFKRCSLWEALVYWKSDERNNQQVAAFMRNYGSISPKLYKYLEIKKITNSFTNKLGDGGYGFVYKGKLSDGRQVAVKVLKDNKGNGEEFINEVASISRTSHVNVVKLLGFSYNRNRRALIYEFMPNGSLDKFIYHKKRSSQDMTRDSQLEWIKLFEIAVGIARGLEYLHRGCNTRIVHFDIKPHNILLDEDFCPKISDFGLAKLCETKQSILSTIGTRGTAGYIAPEVFCRNFGGISHKSDVYSYGMMLLEIVGLRKQIATGSEQSSEKYFPNWIYEHLELGKDLEIQDVTNEEEEENSRKMILVGLWCIQTNPADRPSMSKVVEMLEGSLEHLQIPPKPFLDSPPMATQESWTSSTS